MEYPITAIARNKNEAIVVDINDCISIFNNWNTKRQSFYKSRNFKITVKNKAIKFNDENFNITECLIAD
jgi:hypothetical protein